MSREHKAAILGIIIGLTILTVFSVVVASASEVTDFRLNVKPLPIQPELTVEQGSSRTYEDGSIQLQPAGSREHLQTTAKDLQGN